MKRLEYLRRRPSETKGKAELCATSRVLKLKKKETRPKKFKEILSVIIIIFFYLDVGRVLAELVAESLAEVVDEGADRRIDGAGSAGRAGSGGRAPFHGRQVVQTVAQALVALHLAAQPRQQVRRAARSACGIACGTASGAASGTAAGQTGQTCDDGRPTTTA